MRKTKQIVYNLLSNAVKFSANGGRVTLRARRVPRGAVGTLPGAWPVHGFPLADNELQRVPRDLRHATAASASRSENMAKLFQAFSQIDSSLARKFEGTGLGLAMVKQLAELHGGTVAVASAEGEGACFAAWLPLRTPSTGAPTRARRRRSRTVAAADAHEERIALVVEDDDRAADLVRLLLEAEGFTVLRAASAEAALALAPQQTLSLITLDLQLPGIDGWEFLAAHPREQRPGPRAGGDHRRRGRQQPGAGRRRRRRAAKADQPRPAEGLAGQPRPACRPRSTPHTILVVDDDPKAVEVIAAFLPAPAYAVVRAYGGSEAIALAQRLRPDLILLDLMMPDVSGFDVVEALQRDPDTGAHPDPGGDRQADHGAGPRRRSTATRATSSAIVDKAGFNRAGFIAEVRRALPPQ